MAGSRPWSAPCPLTLLENRSSGPWRTRALGCIHYHYYYSHGCLWGFAGDAFFECTRSASTIACYQKRISGPLLARIDIHVEAPRVEYEQLTDRREGERSAEVRQHCEVDPVAQPLLRAAMQRLQFSARALQRISSWRVPPLI